MPIVTGELLTAPEAAQFAGVTFGTIKHAVARMRMRSMMVDGRRVIERAEVERWMRERNTDCKVGWQGTVHRTEVR